MYLLYLQLHGSVIAAAETLSLARRACYEKLIGQRPDGPVSFSFSAGTRI